MREAVLPPLISRVELATPATAVCDGPRREVLLGLGLEKLAGEGEWARETSGMRFCLLLCEPIASPLPGDEAGMGMLVRFDVTFTEESRVGQSGGIWKEDCPWESLGDSVTRDVVLPLLLRTVSSAALMKDKREASELLLSDLVPVIVAGGV